MGLGDGKHDSELLKSQAHVWAQLPSLVSSMSLKCAIDLGIPDVIHEHGKPITLPHLIAALQIHPSKVRSVPRLLRILVHSGFLSIHQSDEEEGYALTNHSQLLLKDNPLRASPLLNLIADPDLTKPWYYVSQWFQNDDPTAFETAHGKTFWEYAGNQPMLNQYFNEAMASDARLVSDVLIRNCRGVFDGLSSLVDVGGGTGVVANAIAKAFPQLDCTVFDLPHVVAGLQGTDNVKFVGGSMFESIPPADAVLLKWILHDWNDEECLKILKQAKEAIKGKVGGKVIIIDMVVEGQKGDEKSLETQLFFDMLMMVLYAGKERSEKEWANLFSSAGFSTYKITHALGLRSIIELYP